MISRLRMSDSRLDGLFPTRFPSCKLPLGTSPWVLPRRLSRVLELSRPESRYATDGLFDDDAYVVIDWPGWGTAMTVRPSMSSRSAGLHV